MGLNALSSPRLGGEVVRDPLALTNTMIVKPVRRQKAALLSSDWTQSHPDTSSVEGPRIIDLRVTGVVRV